MADNKKNTIQRKKVNLLLAAVAVLFLCLSIVLSFFLKGDDSQEKADLIKEKESQTIEAGDSLVISVNEVSTTARFYPIEVDGTQMEVIAVKDSEGNIRTAFNTCQICYSSGKGYYVQDGDVLVCQNCGSQFTVNQVEIESGGCNPWPIFSEDKTVTEDSVSISYDFLKEATQVFANWKASY